MKTKVFDCVEVKRRGARRINRELEGLGSEEQLAYWEKATKELIRRKKETTP